MKAYIGTKIILAEEMLKGEFDQKFRGESGQATTSDFGTEGYHVRYSNPNGSDYDSWSPKNVFERAYRIVSEDEQSLLLCGGEEALKEDTI